MRLWNKVGKLGPRYYYPRVPLPEKVKAIIVNARIFTLGLPVVGGWLVIEASLGKFNFLTPDPWVALTAIGCMMLINATGNYVNSIIDLDIDKINKPYRPLPSGKLTVAEAKIITACGLVLSSGLALLVNTGFAILALVALAFTVMYSVPPFRLKRFLWVNNGVQALIRGVLSPLAMWNVFARVNGEALGLCALVGLFILFNQGIKDFKDVEGDRKYGIKTLPVVYGPSRTKKIMAGGTGLTLILAGWLTAFHVFPNPSFVVILTPVLAAFVILLTLPMKDSPTENSIQWAGFYLSMIAIILLFLVSP